MAEKVVRPGVWRHYKGNRYRVLFITDYTGAHGPVVPFRLEADIEGFPEGTKIVVYIGLYDNPHGNRECSRPVREWLEELVDVKWIETASGVEHTYTGPRYAWVGEQ